MPGCSRAQRRGNITRRGLDLAAMFATRELVVGMTRRRIRRSARPSAARRAGGVVDPRLRTPRTSRRRGARPSPHPAHGPHRLPPRRPCRDADDVSRAHDGRHRARCTHMVFTDDRAARLGSSCMPYEITPAGTAAANPVCHLMLATPRDHGLRGGYRSVRGSMTCGCANRFVALPHCALGSALPHPPGQVVTEMRRGARIRMEEPRAGAGLRRPVAGGLDGPGWRGARKLEPRLAVPGCHGR